MIRYAVGLMSFLIEFNYELVSFILLLTDGVFLKLFINP